MAQGALTSLCATANSPFRPQPRAKRRRRRRKRKPILSSASVVRRQDPGLCAAPAGLDNSQLRRADQCDRCLLERNFCAKSNICNEHEGQINGVSLFSCPLVAVLNPWSRSDVSCRVRPRASRRDRPFGPSSSASAILFNLCTSRFGLLPLVHHYNFEGRSFVDASLADQMLVARCSQLDVSRSQMLIAACANGLLCSSIVLCVRCILFCLHQADWSRDASSVALFVILAWPSGSCTLLFANMQLDVVVTDSGSAW